MRHQAFLASALSIAALAACTSATSEDDDATSDVSEVQALSLSCRRGEATFDVASQSSGIEGTLTAGALNTKFDCTPGAVSAVVANCVERPQDLHPGQWKFIVTKTNPTTTTATLVRGGSAPELAFACNADGADGGTATDAGPLDAGPDAQDAGPGADASVPTPTYAEIAPVIAETCGVCHQATFGTLERVKAKRTKMFQLVSIGKMPRGNPTWKDSADGRALLSFLQNSPELQ